MQGYEHGRPQTFFQGRAKFSRGAKTYYWSKKCLKTYYFHSKKSKNILFGPAREGQVPPLALPADARGYEGHNPWHTV